MEIFGLKFGQVCHSHEMTLPLHLNHRKEAFLECELSLCVRHGVRAQRVRVTTGGATDRGLEVT